MHGYISGWSGTYGEESDETLESEEFCKYDEEISDEQVSFGNLANFCIPGEEIPLWFSCQNIGSSLLLTDLRHCDRRMFMGFAFCAVVVCYGCDSCVFDIKCRCHFITKSGRRCVRNSYCGFNRVNMKEVELPLQSEHTFLCYDSSMYRSASPSYKALFEFHPIHRNERRIHRCDVIKCGIHLLFAGYENLQEGVREPALKRLQCNAFVCDIIC
ncbi:disease resistance protein RPP2B isoform X2 [Hevea brasiliensis]|uniref:disease resistance protein RPP2B isoform X2 n=1 Tax=Hevea brasiliensis TaxID=3981 RepID=UPI0025CC8ADE|nr:disease resistance protein RPP2B isoform X2 [Hevea brasiliensis]